MLRFASNKYRLVAETICWCFPRNQQQAVTPTRPSEEARTSAIAPKRLCCTERSRNTGRRSWPIWKRAVANCPPSCLTSSRPIFVVAFRFMAFCAYDAETADTAESSLSRVSAVDSVRRALAAAWPTRRLSEWITFFPRVPTRQYVLSLPYALRFKLAYSANATGVVLGAFINAINSNLRRRARKHKLHGRLQTGSLTVVQRFGSSLNLNVHFHTIAMDGVYAEQPDGSMLFHPLPAPSDEDIARLARAVCRKVTGHVEHLTGEDKDQQLTLDRLANASVQGLVATGPRRGCRVLRLGFGRGKMALEMTIHREFISMGAAGWHICLDVLGRFLAGDPLGHMVGPEVMKFGGWQRLNAEYAK